MKRTALQRRTPLRAKAPMKRGAVRLKVRIRPTAPARATALSDLGCCVCRRQFGVHTPCDPHHLKGHPWSSAGKRADDRHTIGLCKCHHTDGDGSERFGGEVGYHYSPAEFEARYGTQAELLAYTDALLGVEDTE